MEANLRNLVEEKTVAEPIEGFNEQIHELIGQRQTITDRIREISQRKHDLQIQITEADRRQKRLRSVLESQANAKQKLLQKLTEFRRDGNNAPIKSYEYGPAKGVLAGQQTPRAGRLIGLSFVALIAGLCKLTRTGFAVVFSDL